MFCDMVGSSALSTRLDPEEQRDVVSAFQTCCAHEIERLGGMIGQPITWLLPGRDPLLPISTKQIYRAVCDTAAAVRIRR